MGLSPQACERDSQAVVVTLNVIAWVEGKEPLRASGQDFSAKKPGIEFRVLGRSGEEISFDNLRVWELK